MIDVQERNDIDPICPHCEEALRAVYARAGRGLLGKRFVYFCAACRKVLGVSHRKGFWMG